MYNTQILSIGTAHNIKGTEDEILCVLFLSWWGDFVTVRGFAEYYGINDMALANYIIEEGKKVWNEGVTHE